MKEIERFDCQMKVIDRIVEKVKKDDYDTRLLLNKVRMEMIAEAAKRMNIKLPSDWWGKENKMKFKEKIKQAKEVIKELKEDKYFERVERAKSLLKFALFYLSIGQRRKANYRLNKILQE